jgi:geranylgeranyl diphosphate synthase, type II
MIDLISLEDKKQRLEITLCDIIARITDQDTLIKDIVSYIMLPTGRLIRPLLTVLIYEMLGGTKGKIYTCACAAEMIHVATLILDDLPCMDNSAYRRGKSSCHTVFGDANATLIAFGLAAESFQILSDKNNFGDINTDALTRMLQEISKKIGFTGLTGGQIADLNGGTSLLKQTDTAQKLTYITRNKTAVLFEVCALIACCLAEATQEDTDHMITYAHNVGFALQLFDDLHDDKEDTGLSFVKIYGIDKTKELLQSTIKTSYACITHTNEPAKLLKQLPQLLLEIST